jgi:hypothetical protein
MKKTVWTFGLIAGGILSAMMLLTMPFLDRIGYDHGEVIGYTTMVLAFLLVFFGIRSYRDNVAGGTVSFGRALAVGVLIVAVASVCYVATWELLYFWLAPGIGETLQAHMLEQARSSGASAAEVQQKVAEMQRFARFYRNPLVNSAITFIEPLPVGVVLSLVSAGILSRQRRSADAGLAPAAG